MMQSVTIWDKEGSALQGRGSLMGNFLKTSAILGKGTQVSIRQIGGSCVPITLKILGFKRITTEYDIYRIAKV